MTTSTRLVSLALLCWGAANLQAHAADPQGTTELPKMTVQDAVADDNGYLDADKPRTENDAQPYTIFESEEIRSSGATTIEEFLGSHLTRTTQQGTLVQHQNTNTGIFTPNNAINLNGAGANETLILVDGRRLANVSFNGNSYTGAGTSQPDVNGIPLAMVERIEVLPSSAAALYGASSVGGVINIILKKQFNGGEVSYDYNDTFNGSDPKRALSAVLGSNFNKGATQLMFSVNHTDGGSLTVGDRIGWLNRINGLTDQIAPWINGFSAFATQGALPNILSNSFDSNNNKVPLTLKNGSALNSLYTYVPAGTSPTTSLATLGAGLLANAGQQNTAAPPIAVFQGALNRLDPTPSVDSQFLTLRQHVNDELELFGQLAHTNNRLDTPFDPVSQKSVSASNPFNPFQQDVTIFFPYVSSATAHAGLETTTGTVGLTSHLAHGWRADIDYTKSVNVASYSAPVDTWNGDGGVQQLIDAGQFNPFVDTLQYPVNLDQYLSQQGEQVRSTVDSLALRAGGPVGAFAWGEPQLDMRLEARREGYGNDVLTVSNPAIPPLGQAASSSQTTYFGQTQDVLSGGAELDLPLVTNKNAILGVRDLSLQLALSYDRYTVHAVTPDDTGAVPAGTAQHVAYSSVNPTFGVRYSPVQDVILRASYGRSFQPPQPSQLVPSHNPACGYPCTLIVDPKTNSQYLIDTYGAGNPALTPQNGKSINLGVIWAPVGGYLEGLRINVEHYRIDQAHLITSLSAQQVIDTPSLSSRVNRDPTTGLITSVDTSLINAFNNSISGWDLKLDYSLPQTAFGQFSVKVAYTHIVHDLRQWTAGAAPLDYAGYPDDGGEPAGKGYAWLQWDRGPWMARWTSTYTSGYQTSYAASSPDSLQGYWTGYSTAPDATLYSVSETQIQGGTHIPSQLYHDLLVRRDFGKHLRAMLGLSNVFNKAPPMDVSGWYPLSIAFGDGFRGRAYRLNLRYMY